MSKKTTKSGGLTSIKGGKDGGTPTPGGSTHEPGNGMPTDAFDTVNGNVASPGATSPTKVIDFSTVRAQRSLDNRRTVERFFLQHMIDVYCEIDGGTQQLPINIVEVSETGCSFRMTSEKAQSLPRDTTGTLMPIHARFYFSKESYLRIGFFVVNTTREIGTTGNNLRFGCRVDETFAATEAYREFVRFMEQFARHAHRDSKKTGSY